MLSSGKPRDVMCNPRYIILGLQSRDLLQAVVGTPAISYIVRVLVFARKTFPSGFWTKILSKLDVSMGNEHICLIL